MSEISGTKLRKVQKKVGDIWEDTRMSELKAGDIFRLFENDGTPVSLGDVTELTAASYPTLADGVWGIYVNSVD